jgi:hypothetical protein
MGSQPHRWGGGGLDVLHISKVLSIAEVKVSICEQKYSHTGLTRNGIENPLIGNPVLYLYTTKCFKNTGSNLQLSCV